METGLAGAGDVIHNSAASRFELRIGDDVAHADYVRRGNAIVFTHTEVPPHLEGRGLGTQLAKAALDYARTADLRVVPRCPFIADYIAQHPEYQTLRPKRP